MSAWIELPPYLKHAEPFLVGDELNSFRHYLAERDATVVEVDVSDCAVSGDVIARLREVLPFPEWAGSSWDGMEDVYGELQDAWNFPLVVLVHGLEALLLKELHLGLEMTINFSRIAIAFSRNGSQALFVYLVDA